MAKSTIEVKCSGYYELDAFGKVSYDCPNESKKHFFKKPSLYRCNACWKKIIASEKTFYVPIEKHIKFCCDNASYWENFRGFLIPFNSKNEPLIYSDYLQWLYVHNKDKYNQLLAARNEKVKAVKAAIVNSAKRKETLKNAIKISSLLNKFKRRELTVEETLRTKQHQVRIEKEILIKSQQQKTAEEKPQLNKLQEFLLKNRKPETK